MFVLFMKLAHLGGNSRIEDQRRNCFQFCCRSSTGWIIPSSCKDQSQWEKGEKHYLFFMYALVPTDSSHESFKTLFYRDLQKLAYNAPRSKAADDNNSRVANNEISGRILVGSHELYWCTYEDGGPLINSCPTKLLAQSFYAPYIEHYIVSSERNNSTTFTLLSMAWFCAELYVLLWALVFRQTLCKLDCLI